MSRLFVLLLCSLICACAPSPQSEHFYAFGTDVTVQLEDVSPEHAKQLFLNVDKQLQSMHQRWHAWQDSELSEIRKACQTGKAIPVSEDVAYLIQEGALLEQQSLGYFNPAIGELIDAWGFLSQTSTQDRPAPSPEVINTLLSYQPSLKNITIKNNMLSCNNPHVRLDFGAYAKGYGIGKIIDYLREQGVTQAIINAGGDLMILQAPGKPARRIGIQSPDADFPIDVLTISESTSVFTSGTYARRFKDTQTNKSFHHLINPKTGYPSTDFVSVTVIHPDPLRADAAATALLASNKENWLSVAQGMGIEKYLLITAEGETIQFISP